MNFLPLAVIWTGYLVGWYGYAMMQGPGMGFTDLLLPSRVSKVESVIGLWPTFQRSSPQGSSAAKSGAAPPPAGETNVAGGTYGGPPASGSGGVSLP